MNGKPPLAAQPPDDIRQKALEQIDAMPRYDGNLQVGNWQDSLLSRYHRALDLARAALSSPTPPDDVAEGMVALRDVLALGKWKPAFDTAFDAPLAYMVRSGEGEYIAVREVRALRSGSGQ